jgi:type IV pilus assembly protein PilA
MNKKKKNNPFFGFTLVELLTVIVILAIVLVIAIPGIMKIINKSKYDSYNDQEQIIKTAATKYVVSAGNSFAYDENNSYAITLADLIAAGYLKSPIIDTRTNIVLDEDTTTIVISKLPENKYNYAVLESTTVNDKTLSLSANLKGTSTLGILDPYIVHVQTSTTVDQLLLNFNNANQMKIYNVVGNEITGATTVGTGCTIKLFDGSNIADQLTFIVYGDITGDGLISITDLINIKKYTLGLFDNINLVAADINKDLIVNAVDMDAVKNHLLVIQLIVQ